MYSCCVVDLTKSTTQHLLSKFFVATHSSWSMMATCGPRKEFKTSRWTVPCQTCVMVMFHSYHCVAVRMKCGTALLPLTKTPLLWVNNLVTKHYFWLVTCPYLGKFSESISHTLLNMYRLILILSMFLPNSSRGVWYTYTYTYT